MFVRVVWYIFPRGKHLLWLAPKLIQPFPFPSLGFIGAHHFRSPIANRRAQIFLSNIYFPARVVTRLAVLEDYWNKSYRWCSRHLWVLFPKRMNGPKPWVCTDAHGFRSVCWANTSAQSMLFVKPYPIFLESNEPPVIISCLEVSNSIHRGM